MLRLSYLLCLKPKVLKWQVKVLQMVMFWIFSWSSTAGSPRSHCLRPRNSHIAHNHAFRSDFFFFFKCLDRARLPPLQVFVLSWANCRLGPALYKQTWEWYQSVIYHQWSISVFPIPLTPALFQLAFMAVSRLCNIYIYLFFFNPET